ncbi:phosphoinositide 3-kinase regulatory subunit 4-like isoform X2 [Ostrea edulis]|uniref:phosphoinositide 3-kinase regulatory subunit 4-like isoform X2 n=1 Tax=Ostrea edulis TaxID=37623 RepID=UPI0024AEE0D5|nr:phosphoinositide 3-kinase regulatory subunit 4-like isoform X2 [Ostrea edulis]
MGNQLTGIAPSQIQPVDQYLTDIQDYQYENSLGSTRFFKVARARTKEGLAVVKVFVIHDPSLPLASHRNKLEDIHIRLQGSTSNCLPFQRAIQSDKAALIFRQYVKDSLYDRISTRPFLNKIEKKWLAFQLLCALNQCHKIKVCHGDIKAENVMISSWNWLLLTDFASFKPTYLPEDNPSDFSYFFDTSRRRCCYIAPERFVESGLKNQEGQGQTIDLTSGDEVKAGDLTPPMDIFSAGCVICELFTEGTPPFDFSQLLAYRNGEYSPWKVLEKIDDNYIRDLVRHMIKKDPSHRLSAEEYMIQQRGKAFPEYFYTFLKIYLQQFVSTPVIPPDDRISKIKRDFPRIIKSLCPQEERSEENVGLVLIISLLGSSARKLHFCNSKLTALQLLLETSKFVTTDIILDRIIPYMLSFANDQFPRVRAEVIRVVTQCLVDIDSIPRSDANVFPEYIFPNITHLTQDPVVMVRAAYAENIAKLAETALRVLEMTQRIDLEENEEEEAVDGLLYQANYDIELLSLQETIQQKVVTLLSDPDNSVKQTLLENGITKLCVFFGRQKANDVLLSHMITFLNDKTDWHLRGSFFDNIVGVAAYVGWQSCSILKPLLDQGLSDSEEFVIHKTLGVLQALTELGLIQKAMLQEFLHEVVPFLAHPGIWIRQGAVGFISALTRTFNIADIHCKVLPALQPCLKKPILQVDKEIFLLNALQSPIPRSVFDYILRVNQPDRLFDILRERQYMRSISRQGHRTNYPELDESMSQVFKKLTSFGMDESHEDKILAMKDYVMKLHRSRAGSVDTKEEMRDSLGVFCIVGPGKAITRRHAELIKQKDLKQQGVDLTVSSRSSKKSLPKDQSINMNSEWKSMFGSNESDSSTNSMSPKVKTLQKTAETLERKLNTSQTLSQSSSSSGSFVTMSQSQMSVEGSARSVAEKGLEKNPTTRYNNCKIALRNIVHKKRELYSAESKDLLEIAWERRPPPSNWKPKGLLVAHLQEHRGAINRIQVSSDHAYFASASNDGTVKLWESEKLEGNSVANRSKQTLKETSVPGEKVKGLVFCEAAGPSLSLATFTDLGAIHIFKVETGKATWYKNLNVDKVDYGNIVDINFFDTGAQSVLSYATVNGYLVGHDLRSNKEIWKLRNDPKSGLITSFAVHHSQCWLAVGTSSGTHVCWDMRFQLPINSIVHPTGARVRRLIMHPQEQSWLISATQGNNEVSIWDVETGARQKALWASPTPTLSLNQASHHSVYGLHIAVTDTNVFMLTGGSDMRARFWDISYPANSFILAGAASDPVQQTGVNYRAKIVDGVEVIQEFYTKKQVTNDDTPRRGPEAPPQGHRNIISDINLCQTSQCLVITGSRDGVIKVWK